MHVLLVVKHLEIPPKYVSTKLSLTLTEQMLRCWAGVSLTLWGYNCIILKNVLLCEVEIKYLQCSNFIFIGPLTPLYKSHKCLFQETVFKAALYSFGKIFFMT